MERVQLMTERRRETKRRKSHALRQQLRKGVLLGIQLLLLLPIMFFGCGDRQLMGCWDWPGDGGGRLPCKQSSSYKRKANKLNATTILHQPYHFPHREVKKRIHMIGRKKHVDFDILNTELAPTEALT